MITLNDISINYGSRILFNKINLRISGKERIGLIGVNGAGKSTLLKLICGLQKQDKGEIIVSKHTTVGYLPQESVNFSGKSIFQEVYDSAEDITYLQKEIDDVEWELKIAEDKSTDSYLDLFNEYSELMEKFQFLDGYKLNSKVEKILLGLGFQEIGFNRPVEEFSGGWQMRIALAKLLLKNPSILLLDEPTNHLDIESLVWLENYLINYSGAILIVSHDKNFLNNITNRSIEISGGSLTIYSGNYNFFLSESEKRKELTENRVRNRQKYINEQEKFIERFRYKATKAKAVQSRIKMLDKIDIIETEEDEKSIRFRFPPAMHSGKIVMEISNLSKSYNGKDYVFEDINLNIKRGEKIAFLGVNGSGKSTMSRIIAGIEPFDKGIVKDGYLAEKKYFAQNQAEELDHELTVLETMERTSKNQTPLNLRSILGGFLFKGDDVYKKVGVLSGGEKSRLALAKMLIEPSNFLILDEPTNHLDIPSKDILKDALRNYEGTVIIVSHDREFIDGIVNKVIEFKNKKINIFIGNSSDYLKTKQMNELQTSYDKPGIEADRQDIPNENTWLQVKNKNKEYKKQITKHKKIIQKYENEISEYEYRKNEIEKEMSVENFYKDVNKAVDLKNEYKDILENLGNLNLLWETEIEILTNIEKLNQEGEQK
ncbi:MAG TPA: ABC-F family ATP-binding cassette domain-containing protein [Ignavibacteria bacterium]